MIDIVNVKAEPVLISGLWNTPGFYPAYHMNKTNWITIALDGTAPDDMVKMLVNMSFEETRKKQSNLRDGFDRLFLCKEKEIYIRTDLCSGKN